jgi:hypothetical protein
LVAGQIPSVNRTAMPDDTQSILGATRHCVQAILRYSAKSKDRKTSTKLENELGRVKIWAGNIGVFADGNASTDHRLRNNPDIKLAIVQMLMRVVKELETLMEPSAVKPPQPTISQSSHQSAIPESPLSSRSSSPSIVISSESDTESVVMPEDNSPRPFSGDSHLQVVEEIVGRLYRLASVIRRPITYSENARIADFVRTNRAAHDLCAELASHVRFQIEHIQFRRNGNDLEFDVPSVPPFLVNRLVQAAVLRRQRLLYRERHQKKLDHGSKFTDLINLDSRNNKGQSMSHPAINENATLLNEANASQKPANPPNSLGSSLRTVPLSATEASLINLKPRSSALSAVTRSAVTRRERLDVPPPPRIDVGTKDVICPYCFMILKASATKLELWT